ncbi:MAG: glycosyltransferase family 4 protein [Bacteroidia bacterium]|nr:glycosyltransferase family 4 protein [Bacteroidia bacterium]
MNIALIHHRLTRNGGLETRLINYLQTFEQQGHQVTVVCGHADSAIKVPENVSIVQLGYGFLPKKFRRYAFEQRVQRYMETHLFDFSLSLERTSSQDAVLAPSNHLGFLRAMNRKGKSFSDRMEISMDRRAYYYSRYIFAASQMMKEELVELYRVPDEKIHILYPPLDTTKFNLSRRPYRNELRQQLGMAPDKITFVFVSTSHKRKGLPLLLEVFGRLEDSPFELKIVGKGSVPLSSLPSNVSHLGYIQDTAALFTAADFTIHPARYEPFGQIITESIACGTPVLISDKVGACEILTENEGIILKSFDPDEWEKTLRSLHQQTFTPNPDFAALHQLSVSDHISRMLNLMNL